ncbi:hypothetical protein [Burkholderia gladioli]|uniref:hypothetical protein n=1 Tax=Burkholderia gladioli TaxID=28095 RepID=UPI00164107BE|nr:hypothetical protein [Burkholderia gladioli]
MEADQRPMHADPLLADISELLRRMALCTTVAPFTWMARDAIGKLEQYEAKLVTDKTLATGGR